VVRRSRFVLLLAMTVALLVAAPVAAQPTVHRAVVVVETGTAVKRVCVRFTEDSISGKDALDRAGVDPVYRSYGGSLGAAVCSLCGVGRTYADCLGSGGSSAHWVYWRSPAGAGSFTRSSFGVSSTRVRDGDVEGWRWGASEPPGFALVAEVCGPEDPPPSTAPPPRPPAASAGQPRPAPPKVAVTGRGAPAATTVSTAAATTTSLVPEAPEPGPDADPRSGARALGADRRVSDTGDGGPDASLLAFGALLAGLVGASALVRRRRRRPGG
jgi:hypothetical protein